MCHFSITDFFDVSKMMRSSIIEGRLVNSGLEDKEIREGKYIAFASQTGNLKCNLVSHECKLKLTFSTDINFSTHSTFDTKFDLCPDDICPSSLVTFYFVLIIDRTDRPTG